MSDSSANTSSADPSSTLVIIPTYNEADNIEELLERILGLDSSFDVLVVDDNSPDGTADQVRSVKSNYPTRVHVLERQGKLGLGSAYIRGFHFALDGSYQYVCEMDADFSHNPDDLPSLVGAVKKGADLAIGSRYVDGVRVINWPLSRLVLSYAASLYTRIITGLPITDVTAGFKCYDRSILEALPLEKVKSNGYAFQIEMKYRAWVQGFTLVEVPIIFTERTEGESKMSRSIVIEAAWKVWELRIRRLFRIL